jgi:hypothetical protein
VKRRVVIAIVVAGTLAGIGVGVSSIIPGGGAEPSAAASGVDNARLQSVLAALSQANGEASPTNITAVGTDRVSALKVLSPGDVVNTAPVPVYVLSATGSFTGYGASFPRNAAPPTGRFLWVVVDAQTGEALDWGISPSAPNLASLGSPTSLG